MTDHIKSLEERIEETKEYFKDSPYDSTDIEDLVLQNQITIMQTQVEILKLLKGEKPSEQIDIIPNS